MAIKPTSYINLTTYHDHVTIVRPGSQVHVDIPEDAMDDPDAYESWVLALAKQHGVSYVRDEDLDAPGEFWTLDEWTQDGV